jgi:hypothetical protein
MSAPAAPRAPAAQGKPDPQSEFLFNAIERLSTKVNNEIQIKKTGNSMTMSNISDTDLQKIQFITSTDQSKRHLKMTNCGVSINDSNGTSMQLSIPGFPQMVSQMFINSASESFLAGEKTHKPFKPSTAKAVAPQSSVSDMVDKMTAMMPSMPKTAGKDKKYNITMHTAHASVAPTLKYTPGGRNGYYTCPHGSRVTTTPLRKNITCTPTFGGCPPGSALTPAGQNCAPI